MGRFNRNSGDSGRGQRDNREDRGRKSFGGRVSRESIGRNGRRDSSRGFGGNRRGGSRDRNSRPEMHKVVCDECGKDCEVPFKPTGDKPVHCSDCFKTKGNKSGSGQDYSKELKEINEKLDKILSLLDSE